MTAEPDLLCSTEMNTVNPFYAIQSKRARDLQPLRSANLAVGVLTLILLVAVPVSGAPALKVGSNSSYTLSFSITFSPPFCETSPSSDPQMIVYCPMIAIVPPTFNIDGTLDWTATSLTNTTAVMNVVREVTTSSWDSLAATDFRSLHSFNESIDLATRIANIVPFVTPEMSEALQIAQNSMGMTLSQGTGWTTPATIITSDMMERQPIHTMWWANGPLHLNQTIPVLFFPTNVTGSTLTSARSLRTHRRAVQGPAAQDLAQKQEAGLIVGLDQDLRQGPADMIKVLVQDLAQAPSQAAYLTQPRQSHPQAWIHGFIV